MDETKCAFRVRVSEFMTGHPCDRPKSHPSHYDQRDHARFAHDQRMDCHMFVAPAPRGEYGTEGNPCGLGLLAKAIISGSGPTEATRPAHESDRAEDSPAKGRTVAPSQPSLRSRQDGPDVSPRGEEKRCVCFKPSGEPDGPRYDCPIHGQDATAEPPAPAPKHTRHAKGLEPGCPGCATAPRGEEKRGSCNCTCHPVDDYDGVACGNADCSGCGCRHAPFHKPPAPAPSVETWREYAADYADSGPVGPGPFTAPAPSAEEVATAIMNRCRYEYPQSIPSAAYTPENGQKGTPVIFGWESLHREITTAIEHATATIRRK